MTTLNLQVSAGADDAEESLTGTSFNAASTSLRCSVSANRGSGTRFSGVTIPQAATIDSAVWQGYVTSSKNDDPDLNIHFHEVDDSPDFASSADLDGRARSTTFVLWSATGIGSGGYRSAPDITSVVQAAVDRAGWASGNAITVILWPNGGSLTVASYEANPAQTAKLDIDYTAGGGGGASIRRYSLSLTGVG